MIEKREVNGRQEAPVKERLVARPRPPAKRARKAQLPHFVRPQLATLVDRVPPGGQWLHELKFDGYRILSRIDKGRVSLFTREAHDWTERFKGIAEAAEALPVRQAFLDGEIAALKDDGSTDFQLLQNALREKSAVRLVYFVFDLLHLDGRDLTSSPLLARKELLEKILLKTKRNGAASDIIRFSEHWIGEGETVFEKACQSGLEGIVSKRTDQPYRPMRSRDWLKIKCLHSQEFVIGGFTDPAGSRSAFGALLLGVYDEKHALRYAGKVGTGFSETTLHGVRRRMDKLVTQASPFVDPLPRRQTRNVHWLKPKLVAEVSFTAWTDDKLLRHPSFKGLREDKPAGKIQREDAIPTAKVVAPRRR
jgi:bifunctional non-homologous end joining protein LigD